MADFECRVCGAKQLECVEEFHSLPRVTSDSKPFPSGGELAFCSRCSAVQKLTSDRWRSDIDSIYQNYSIYHQSVGAEQPIFDAKTGKGSPRSAQILSFLTDRFDLPSRGRALDFGCGSGAGLRTLSSVLAGWELFGSELSDRSEEELHKISGFRRLYTGEPSLIPDRFNLITAFHSLEHVLEPVETIRQLCGRLEHDGYLLVQVPDCGRTPYDLVIADHLTHFTLETLSMAVARSGGELVFRGSEILDKELTAVVGATNGSNASRQYAVTSSVDKVRSDLAWLRAQIDEAKAASRRAERLGILGTSISATWLFGAMGGEVAFFVDEDQARVGRAHFGIPVLAPDQIPKGSEVYVPLIPDVARTVADRLQQPGRQFLVPPHLPTTSEALDE